MTRHPPGERLQLLFDWAHEDGRRLAFWIVVALALHAAAWLLIQTRYPHPEPAQITDASLYVLLPGSPEARRIAPLLATADPALVAPERAARLGLPEPAIPSYQPSYAAAAPDLIPLPDSPTHLLPPLLRDLGPVPAADAPSPPPALPLPAEKSQILFSPALRDRAPKKFPAANFTARPADQLAPSRYLLAIDADGRVLHVVRDSDSGNDVLDDEVSRLLMRLSFSPAPGTAITWGAATIHWGTDVRRTELPGQPP